MRHRKTVLNLGVRKAFTSRTDFGRPQPHPGQLRQSHGVHGHAWPAPHPEGGTEAMPVLEAVRGTTNDSATTHHHLRPASGPLTPVATRL